MRQRIVLGLLGACLMFALECLSIYLMFIWQELIYVAFPISTLGSDFLVFAGEELGWPIPLDERGGLPYTWRSRLFSLDIVFYAALGFFLGWMLARRLYPSPKPR